MYPENNRAILLHEFFSFETDNFYKIGITELQQLLIGKVY